VERWAGPAAAWPGLTDWMHWMRDVHRFNIASTMSFWPSGASINATTTRTCSPPMSKNTGNRCDLMTFRKRS
jgi:hypothetical protein